MREERILSLDISTKTGWALLVSGKSLFLESYGKIEQIHEPNHLPYPGSYVEWANQVFDKILEVYQMTAPDVLVIEETSAGSKAIYTQKILEYIHYLVARFIKENNLTVYYFLTEQWRRETGCKMTKEESQHNKNVSKYKKINKSKIAYDETGKRIGRKTRKHINVRRANEVFGKFLAVPLKQKDEDLADALLLGLAAHLRKYEKKDKNRIEK